MTVVSTVWHRSGTNSEWDELHWDPPSTFLLPENTSNSDALLTSRVDLRILSCRHYQAKAASSLLKLLAHRFRHVAPNPYAKTHWIRGYLPWSFNWQRCMGSVDCWFEFLTPGMVWSRRLWFWSRRRGRFGCMVSLEMEDGVVSVRGYIYLAREDVRPLRKLTEIVPSPVPD